MKDHRLDEVAFYDTPNQGGEIEPTLITVHYTAGRALMSTVRWFASEKSKASSHIVIGRDGKIIQMVPFNRKAWHAGVSEYGGREGCNGFSIGIELCNWGPLQFKNGVYQSWTGATIYDDHVVKASHKNNPNTVRCWEKYTDAQVAACEYVCKQLCKEYEIQDIVGHDEIATPVGRKSDPGPAFDIETLRKAVLGNDVTGYNRNTNNRNDYVELMRLQQDLNSCLKRVNRILDRRND